MIEPTPTLVIERFRQAYETLAALPAAYGPRIAASQWSDARQTFAEAVGAEEGRWRTDGAGKVIKGRDQYSTPQTYWAESFLRAAPPERDEIDLAHETLTWLQYLGGERDLVDALWLTHGAGLGPTDAARAISRARKVKPPSRETVRQRRDLAVSKIVTGLLIAQAPANTRVGLRLREKVAL